MATGDIKNNLKKLQGGLKTVKYEKDVDIESISKGVATSYLPVYHYLFIDYSRPFAEEISKLGVELFGKSDLRFIEAMYKVLREIFSYKPPVTKDQFFSHGFAERKVIMATEIVSMVAKKHKSLMPKPKVKVNLSMNSTSSSNSSKYTGRPSSAASLPPPSKKPDSKRKSDTKESKERPHTSTTVIPQVISAVREPAPGAPALVSDHPLHPPPLDIAPIPPVGGSNVEPATAMGPPVMREVYNPNMYTCEAGTHREGQANVEIVSLQSEDTENSEDSALRPIDIVKTPGRPLVESHRPVSSGQPYQSSPKQQQLPSIDLQQQLSLILQTIKNYEEKFTSIERYVARIDGIENRLAILEDQMNVKAKDLEKPEYENLTARVTLLETRLKLAENQLTQQTTKVTNGYHTGAYESEIVPTSGTRDSDLGSPKKIDIAREQALGISNGHDSPDIRQVSTSVAEKVHTPQHAVLSDSFDVSPIGQSIPRTSVLASSDSPLTIDSNVGNSAFKLNQKCSTPSDGRPFESQADRIKHMLKDTEHMLNIKVDSPVRPTHS